MREDKGKEENIMKREIGRKRSNQKVSQIAISQVLPGMVTAKNVYSRNDQLILNRETTLDSTKIAKIMFYAIESIYVYEPEVKSENDQFMQKMRNSIEFRNFKKDYDSCVVSVQNAMNSVIEQNKELDVEPLLQEMTQTIDHAKSKTDVFYMLQCMIDYDDQTYVHCVNVAMVCNIFADWLGISKEGKETATICGLLHDIGKLTIPKSIVNKPDRLTDQEYEIMKLHTVRGYNLVKNMDLEDAVKQTILLHHERYNGTGYPFQKAGDEIDPFVMLTAIADVYNAMTSDRVYRTGRCPFDVIRELEENGKTLYAPEILIPIMERIAQSYISHTVRLSTDEEGEIVMLNKNFLSKPLVKVENRFIDLSKERSIKINSIL